MIRKVFKNKLIASIVLVSALILIAGITVFSIRYSNLNKPNIFTEGSEKVSVYLRDDTSFEELLDILNKETRVRNLKAFKKASDKMDFHTVRSGHYVIENGMSNKELIRILQRGLQTPVKVTLNNIRTKEQLAHSLSLQLMPDSADIMYMLNDTSFLSSYGLNRENVLVAFIPNTYEFYWNMDEKKMFDRFYNEYKKFWTPERKEKAAEIPLTPIEVAILASIVEEETNKFSEYPIVAGLYINRLKRGMLLQADPTVKFAVGDFGIRRVLNAHLETDSPYNTYMYKGLPPGPIRLASGRVIDAVLNYQKHNYLYMAAKETLNGEHNFAVTLSEHNRNASKYRRALNQLRIYR